MTKAQRAAKAKRAGAKRRKANAAAAFLRKMNPGKKLPAAVRVKRLKGGGISVTPIKVNPGLFSKQRYKKVMHWGGHKGKIPKAWVEAREKYTPAQVKSIRRTRKRVRKGY